MKIRAYALIMLTVLFFSLNSPAWAVDEIKQTPILARPAHAFPRASEYEVLVGDFHVHTDLSDGKVTPRDRVLEAFKYGYDAIAITDHRNFKAYDQVSELAASLGMVLIRGFETGIHQAEHFIVLGVNSDYKPRDSHEWAEKPGKPRPYYQDELRRISEAGGVVIYPHPHMGLREPVLWGIEQGIIIGIEVKNGSGKGWNSVEFRGDYSYPAAFDWSLERNLAIFANSDVHRLRPKNYPMSTLVFARERTSAAVMEAIRMRRTIAQFSGMLWGRQDLLLQLINSTISVRRTTDKTENYIRIENKGPVALKAVLTGYNASGQALDLAPYTETLIPWNDAPETISIRWDNLLINPRENLTTTHTTVPMPLPIPIPTPVPEVVNG